MMTPVYSPLNLARLAHRSPENLLFFSLDKLEAELRRSNSNRADIVAELMVRAFYSEREELDRLVAEYVSMSALKEFRANLMTAPTCIRQQALQNDLWTTMGDPFQKLCQSKVRKRLQSLFQADGFIPVYECMNREQAFLLPFCFDEKLRTGVVDAEGKWLEEWSNQVKQLEIPYGVRLLCTPLEPLCGGSLALPVFLAWKRKERELPQYDVFRLVATGAFDAQGKLAAVEVAEKAKALRENFPPETLFIYPESARKEQFYDPRDMVIPLGLEKEVLFAKVRKSVEELFRSDLRYALRRLDALMQDTRYHTYGNWDSMLKRLENNVVHDKYAYPREYLVNLILRGEVCEHCGKTQKAVEYLRCALEFAEEFGDEYLPEILLVNVDRIETMIDLEEFDALKSHLQELWPRVDKLAEQTLLMRFHGASFRVNAFGCLQNSVDGFSKEAAFSHVKKAIKYATDPRDQTQDRNYKHLYHAIFSPCTVAESLAFEEANDLIRKYYHEENTDSDSYKKNTYFLLRQRAFAAYRFLLKEGRLPDPEYRPKLSENQDLLANAENYLRASTGKYLGALEWVAGKQKDACERFKQACEAINDNDPPGVLTVIRLSVFAEAFRSTHDESYRQKAFQLLERYQDSLRTFHTSHLFRLFLEGKGEFPGLQFWY